jgi:predicted Fe-Mo cluster-binding NifX family protein
MQIAITTIAPGIEAEVDPRFGEAPYVVFVDTENGDWRAYANPAPQFGGHGMVAARFVAMQGANAVVSGGMCPHSFAGLRSIGIALYACTPGGTAAQAVRALSGGALAEAQPDPTHGHGHGHAHGRGAHAATGAACEGAAVGGAALGA